MKFKTNNKIKHNKNYIEDTIEVEQNISSQEALPKKEKVKISDDDKTIDEIRKEEVKKTKRHQSRMAVIQLSILVIVSLIISIQLIVFVDGPVGVLFAGICTVIISLFLKLSEPFNEKLGKWSNSTFWVIFFIGLFMALMSFIYMHVA